MEQNNFYIILGSRGNGRISAQCEYIERAYEEMCKKKQAERDMIGKIINAFSEELVEYRKTLQKEIQRLKGATSHSKREKDILYAYMDVFSMVSTKLEKIKNSIEKKVENIISDYEKEN